MIHVVPMIKTMPDNTARAWTADDVPDQHGRVCLITGGNSGLGLASARVMAARGAAVVIACRDEGRGRTALEHLRQQCPGASIELRRLDLACLADIRAFAEDWRMHAGRLDVLMNNAGLMAIPPARTIDGFEMQLGVNHFGHFALTLALLPVLFASPGSRIVNVSSAMHTRGQMDFDDLFFDRRPYNGWTAYSQSKLANMLFTLELDRRLKKARSSTLAVAAHPGYAATELQGKGPRLRGAKLAEIGMRIGNALVAQSADAGAWPQLRAATDPDVRGGEYFGPTGFMGLRGPAAQVDPAPQARDASAAAQLWNVSERLTGTRFPG